MKQQDFLDNFAVNFVEFCTYVHLSIPCFFCDRCFGTVLFEGFEGFLLSFLEVSPFRVCFVFFVRRKMYPFEIQWI